MLALFGVLIILASFILALFVLIQNPKGGGLSGTLGGFSNQLMGVKQTTDVLEKGTWIFAAAVGLLCLMSPAFIPKNGTASKPDILKGVSAPQKTTVPSTTTPLPGAKPAVPVKP